jgi:prepilin-type N-terminal cleavage/methylation domain-containing protein
MKRSCQRGFTLIEIVIALSIVGALLVIMFGGLRVGLGAWRRGEDRAELLEHERNVEHMVNHAVTASYLSNPGTSPPGTSRPVTSPPAQSPAGASSATQAGILFEGGPDRLAFVTVAPPVPLSAPIAFTAVTISLEAGAIPGLAIRQKALPNTEPFEAVPPLFVDPAVTALRFRYLREVGEDWEERWDATKEKALPIAVEVMMTTQYGSRRIEHAPLVIPIRATPS